MKKLSLIILLFISTNLIGQTFEISTGITSNKFFEKENRLASFTGQYKAETGYHITLSHTGSLNETFKVISNISLVNYNSYVEFNNLINSACSLNGVFNKHAVSIGFYPLSLSVLKRFDFSFGAEFSKHFNTHFKGNVFVPNPSFTTVFSKGGSYNTNYNDNSTVYYIGLSGMASYSQPIIKNMNIVVRYQYHRSLAKEFIDYPVDLYSVRNSFSLGVKNNF